MYRREEVSRYLYWEPRSREQVSEMLERVKKLTSFEAEGHAIRLAAVLPDSGEVIGDVSLNHVSQEHAQGEIGFVINPGLRHPGHRVAGSDLTRPHAGPWAARSKTTIGMMRVVFLGYSPIPAWTATC